MSKACRKLVLCDKVVPWTVLCKSAFTAPNLCWACALASPVTFLTGGHVVQMDLPDLAFGFVYKRSGNEIRLNIDRCISYEPLTLSLRRILNSFSHSFLEFYSYEGFSSSDR